MSPSAPTSKYSKVSKSSARLKRIRSKDTSELSQHSPNFQDWNKIPSTINIWKLENDQRDRGRWRMAEAGSRKHVDSPRGHVIVSGRKGVLLGQE